MNAKKTAGILLKVLGAALAILLVERTLHTTEGNLLNALRDSTKYLIVLAVLCYGIINYIAAWRWRLLLKVQGIHISQWEAFRLTLVGVFFSQIIPGSVSGDIIKLACVIKHAPRKGTEAALTILIDRFLGLYGLFIVAAFSSLLCFFMYPTVVLGNPVIQLAFICVWCAFIGMPLCWFVIFLRHLFLKVPILSYAWNKLSSLIPAKIKDILFRLTRGVDLYRHSQNSILAVLGISCLIHTSLALQIFLLGKAFHEQAMSFVGYLITAQLGNATGLIPLTPGGMGIRDTVSNALLNVFGASPVDVLPLVPVGYTLILVFWALVGAICLLRSPKH